ncbi:Leucine-rich repeat-containing protein 51 [Chytridiales sp. JEL 0842]|nr:Leucine-rich repeat-containing protein 51 [Chytridiales sp. JEL 0842]
MRRKQTHFTGIQQKPQTTAIRLPSNKLTTLTNLFTLSSQLVENPAVNIAWLDLSFNTLPHIDAELLNFPNLSTLYLHANQIHHLSEVDKLGQLQALRTLTLHGNPLENCKNYRLYVVSRIPKLKHLDFCAITKMDRFTANKLLEGAERMSRRKKEADVE